jgi:hypothetical protein
MVVGVPVTRPCRVREKPGLPRRFRRRPQLDTKAAMLPETFAKKPPRQLSTPTFLWEQLKGEVRLGWLAVFDCPKGARLLYP